MEKIFTPAESQALVLIADALEGDRLHEDVTDFSARTLSIAAGTHPHLCEYLLDWLGVFRLHGYRRSVEQLRAAVDAHLESAQRQYAAHLERLRAQGVYNDDPAQHVDVVGEITIGGITFAP